MSPILSHRHGKQQDSQGWDPRVGTPLGTVPLLTAAQPCAQHPHKHNQGPNPAILGQLDPQTGSPSGDYASPALSILMGQILLSLGSQRGLKSFSPSWMWAQEFGVTTAVLSLGQGDTHSASASPGRGCCCLLHPQTGMCWKQRCNPLPAITGGVTVGC